MVNGDWFENLNTVLLHCYLIFLFFLQKLYKAGVVEMANKGYNLKADAIPIQAAKSGTTIASDVSCQKLYEISIHSASAKKQDCE